MRVNRCGSVEMLGWHQNRGLKAPRDESGGVRVAGQSVPGVKAA